MLTPENKEKAIGYYHNALDEYSLVEYCSEKRMYNRLMSRCYYYIFNLCRAIMVMEASDTKSHKVLVGEFNRIIVHERGVFDKKYGSLLNTLERQRGLCDYESNYVMDKDFSILLYNETIEFGQVLRDHIRGYGIE